MTTARINKHKLRKMVFDQATFYHDLIKQSGQPIMNNIYQGIIERGTGMIMLCDETDDEYITVSAEDMAWLNKYLSVELN